MGGVESSLGTDSAARERVNAYPCSAGPVTHRLVTYGPVVDRFSEEIHLRGELGVRATAAGVTSNTVFISDGL